MYQEWEEERKKEDDEITTEEIKAHIDEKYEGAKKKLKDLEERKCGGGQRRREEWKQLSISAITLKRYI